MKFESLSAREREVLERAAAGLLDKEICSELGISMNTLRTYWNRIRSKVGEDSRTALAVAYVEYTLRQINFIDLKDDQWMLNLDTQQMLASDEVNRWHQLEPGRWHEVDLYREHLHPDDKDRIIAAFQDAIASNESNFFIVFRALFPEGEQTLYCYVDIDRDDSGRAHKLRGRYLRAIVIPSGSATTPPS